MVNTRSQPAGSSRTAQGSSSGSGTNTVRQTIVETVEAPRLTGLTTADFVEFKHAREVYERRIAEKNSDPNVSVQLTSYKDSIDPSVLQIFAIGDWVPVDKVAEITEQHLKDCIEARAVVKPKDYDLAKLEEELSSLRMDKPSGDVTLESCVWKFVLEYTQLLNSLGYEKFIDEHPKLAVEHLLKRISNAQLKNQMVIAAKLMKEEDFRKNFNAFVRKMASDSSLMDRMHAARRYKPAASDLDALATPLPDNPPPNSGSRRPPSGAGHRGRKKNKRGRDSNDQGKSDRGSRDSDRNDGGRARSWDKRPAPICLNPKCGERHWVDECPKTSEEERIRLKKELAERRRARAGSHDQKRGRSVGAVQKSDSNDENTSLFSASFCNGALEVQVLTDQGSDGNIISPSILKALAESDPSLEVKPLRGPVEFSNAHSKAKKISCRREIAADVMLRIRHGTNLMLRGIRWLVSDEEVQYVFVARHVLAALGLNNRVLLSAAADRHGGVVDIPALLRKDGHADTSSTGGRESIHSILCARGLGYGSTFHSEGGAEEDFLEDKDVYVDLGEDSPEELEEALADMVAQARANGISDAGAARLENMLKKYPVFD